MQRFRHFLVIFALVACGTPPSPDPASKRVTVGVRGDVSGFNIYTARNAFTQEVCDLLYLKLADEQADFLQGPPTFSPSLAREWVFSEDRRTLTVTLDPGALWGDGRQVTSADVVFSHEMATSPVVGWVGADSKAFVESVRAVDPSTVEYRFTHAYPYQLMDAFEGNILPRHLLADIPAESWPAADFTDAAGENGAFRLLRYQRGALIDLERNPDALRQARLDRLVFRIVPEEVTLMNELLTGGVDVVLNVSEEAASRLDGNPDVSVVRAADLSYTFIGWNLARPLFADARVRRALALGMDRQAIIEGLVPRTGRPAAGPVPSLIWAHHDALEPMPYNPDEARRLLQAAGWSDADGDGTLDRDGVPFRFELETNQESTLRRNVAELVVSQLRSIGVAATVRTFEFGTAIDRREKGDFDAFVSSWRESTKVDLWGLFHSDAIQDGYNYGSYSRAEADALIERARAARSAGEALPHWRKLQERVVEDQPYAFLFERDRLHAVRNGLAGFEPTPRSALSGLESWHWTAR